MKRAWIVAAAMALVASSCMGGGGANQRTVLVDFSHDEFASAMFANFPKKLAVTQGDTVVFKQIWTGEPHTVTGGTLVDEMIGGVGHWIDFFEAFEALERSGAKLPDPEDPPKDMTVAEFWDQVRKADDKDAAERLVTAYEGVSEEVDALPSIEEGEDISFGEWADNVSEESDKPFEKMQIPWAIDETEEGDGFVTQNAGQPCFLTKGAPPEKPGKACNKADQKQPEFDGTQSYYNSGVIPYEGPQGNTFKVKMASDIEPGDYAFYCAVHGPGQRTIVTVKPEGSDIPSQEAVSRQARKEIEEFAAPMLSAFRDARDNTIEANGDEISGPFSGLSAPTHGTINTFVPKTIKADVGEEVTWKIMGSDHTVTFDVPEYFPIIRFAKGGKVAFNPKLQAPAGGSPEIPDVEEGEILKVDGGTYNGSGFYSSGLFGGDPYAEYTLRFSRPGSYKYACLLHPPMVGTVEVT